MPYVRQHWLEGFGYDPKFGEQRVCWCLPKVETVQPKDCVDPNGGVGRIFIHRVLDEQDIDV